MQQAIMVCWCCTWCAEWQVRGTKVTKAASRRVAKSPAAISAAEHCAAGHAAWREAEATKSSWRGASRRRRRAKVAKGACVRREARCKRL